MLWHIKLLRISSGLWICRSHSIWWKLDFCELCNLTVGCNFNNQLLFTAFCSVSVGWIKTNGVIYIPIVFCPLTVYVTLNHALEWNNLLSIDNLFRNSPWKIISNPDHWTKFLSYFTTVKQVLFSFTSDKHIRQKTVKQNLNRCQS